MTQTNFNLKAYVPIIATAYAESKKHTPKEHDSIISDILGRAESGKPEFGADTGSITNVLQTNYNSVKSNNQKYLDAIELKFKSKEDENNFKKAVSRFSGIMQGTIPRTPFEIAKPVGRKSKAQKLATVR